MNQTLFKRVQSQNFLGLAEVEVAAPYDPKTARPATDLAETSRYSAADTTKGSTHRRDTESAFANKSSVKTISSVGIRTSAYKMMTHSAIKSHPYNNNIIK